MDAQTGRRLTGRAHLAQSVGKILSTSVGTRLRRRPFGALAADLIDAPAHGATVLQLYAAAATALMTWEPRLRVRSLAVEVNAARPGRVLLTVNGEADPAALSEPGGADVSITTALQGQP